MTPNISTFENGTFLFKNIVEQYEDFIKVVVKSIDLLLKF